MNYSIIKLKGQLELDEGRRFFPYLDTTGHLTVGVGRNLTDVGLDDDEIDFLLDNDIKLINYQLDFKLPWLKEKPEPVQRALANMCFQLGINELLKFKHTLSFIKKDEYDKAAVAVRKSLWYEQTPKRVENFIALITQSGQLAVTERGVR